MKLNYTFVETKHQNIMENLKSQIEKATTENELHEIINAIPFQENGCQQKIARILDGAFWYMDLDSFEKKRDFMLNQLKQM